MRVRKASETRGPGLARGQTCFVVSVRGACLGVESMFASSAGAFCSSAGCRRRRGRYTRTAAFRLQLRRISLPCKKNKYAAQETARTLRQRESGDKHTHTRSTRANDFPASTHVRISCSIIAESIFSAALHWRAISA